MYKHIRSCLKNPAHSSRGNRVKLSPHTAPWRRPRYASQPRQRSVVARLANSGSPRVRQSARSACRVAELICSRAASCQPSGSPLYRRHCRRRRCHSSPFAHRPCGYAHRVSGRVTFVAPRATSRAAMDHIGLLLQHSQYVYAIPVGIVLVCAILVFVFGFKKAEQPPFAQLSDVDRKLTKKRGKVREKVSETTSVTRYPAAPSLLSAPSLVSALPRALFPRRYVAIVRHMVARLWARVDAHAHTPANQLVPPVREGGCFLLPARRDVMLRRKSVFFCQRDSRRFRHVLGILFLPSIQR